MIYLLLGIVGLLSLYNLMVAMSLKKKIAEAKDSFQSTISWTKEDLRGDIATVKNLVRIIGSGGKVSEHMVEKGQPFDDMSAADAEKFLSQTPPPNAVVIDVRTPGEYQSGHIPGARLIPVEEIETRFHEVPRDKDSILVVCQGGTRSAAACEILSQKGFVNLVNIYDGTASWPGKKEIGQSIRPPASASR
jgi:rhodanese-related sulfurtransferase